MNSLYYAVYTLDKLTAFRLNTLTPQSCTIHTFRSTKERDEWLFGKFSNAMLIGQDKAKRLMNSDNTVHH